MQWAEAVRADGLLGDHVLELERLFQGGDPLGAGRGAAAAALVDIVERGQAAR